jgi:hypothetical protein
MRCDLLKTGLSIVLYAAAGCGQATSDQPKTSEVKGRVDGAPQGSSVSAYHVGGDGKLSAASNGSVQTDAEGRYRIGVTLDPGDGTLMIMAGNGGHVLGAVAVDASAAEATMLAAPIGLRSTVESDLLIAAKASGEWSESASLGALRTCVSDDLAAALKASASYRADVDATARAATAAMEAWSAMLRAGGVTQDRLDVAAAAIARAAVDLDAQLDAAAGEVERRAAFEAFVEARTRALLAAGVTLDQLSTASVAGADTMRAHVVVLPASARAAAMAQAERLRAGVVAEEVSAECAALDASGTAGHAVSAAAADLRARIDAAASAGLDASAQLHDAWAGYRAAVVAQVEALLGVSLVTAAQIEAALDAAVSALSTARTALSADASALDNARIEVEALTHFQSAVLVVARALTDAGVSTERAAAVVRVLAAASAAASAS